MEVVGVMKDKEPKTEEIDVSHRLGGVGECLLQGRGKWRGYTSYSVGDRYTVVIWSYRIRQEVSRYVPKETEGPECM